MSSGFTPHPPRPFTPTGVKGGFNSRFACFAPTMRLLARRCGAGFAPHPPRPFAPTGAKGGFNSRFACFAPTMRLLARRCGAGLLAGRGTRGGRSQWLVGVSAARRDTVSAAYDVRASERVGSGFLPFGRAEQRSGARIRAGACLSAASLRQTPSGASSARQPAGPRSPARLSFAYFSLAKQRKVSRLPGRNPACHARQHTFQNIQ
jgi:hypothetical protein